jgi:hypothetical protein
MFENFKAYKDNFRLTEDYDEAIYLVIFNEKGYNDVVNWAKKCGEPEEVQFIANKESYCYIYDCLKRKYYPLDEEEIPSCLAIEYSEYHNEEKKNTNNTFQKFKIKIQLVNGTTIEPNLYSNDFHEIADVIQELSCEKLFAGQIKNIKIE